MNDKPEGPTSDAPVYYVYKDAQGVFRRTDDRITMLLNSNAQIGSQELLGHEFYPQWRPPITKDDTHPAWYVNKDGIRVVRWRELVRQHNRMHGNFCKSNGDGTCVCKVPIQMIWSDKNKMWVKNSAENLEK